MHFLPFLLFLSASDPVTQAASYIQKTRDTMDYSYLDRAATLLSTSATYQSQRLLTEIQLERHEFQNAAASARALIAKNPNDPWNYGTLGDALLESGEYGPAADAYQRMVNLRPDLSSYNRVAWFRFLSGDVPGAVAIMRRAIESGSAAPENIAWCYVELGHIYAKTAQWHDAADAYRSALRLLPRYHAAEAGLGRVSAAQGDVASAIEHYLHAQAAVPLPDYAAALADLYTALGQTAAADRQMQRIDLIHTLGQAAKEKVNRNLSLIYSDHDRRISEALQLARAELEVRHDIYTWDALAWALYKNRQFSEAASAMEHGLAMPVPEPAFYYHAGLIAQALDRKPEAVAALKKSLALNANFDFRQAPLARKTLEELTQ